MKAVLPFKTGNISKGEKKMSNVKKNTKNMVIAALCLALCMVLPFLTGQVPQVGSMLCPMHFPVLVCGFVCGPVYGAIVGFVAPLLRYMVFGMPQLLPTGLAMCFELAVYGAVSGVLYKLFPKQKQYVYVSLIAAMLAGRVCWGIVRVILTSAGQYAFTWEAFMAGAFLNAVPGIILQIVIVPVIVFAVEKYVKMT